MTAITIKNFSRRLIGGDEPAAYFGFHRRVEFTQEVTILNNETTRRTVFYRVEMEAWRPVSTGKQMPLAPQHAEHFLNVKWRNTMILIPDRKVADVATDIKWCEPIPAQTYSRWAKAAEQFKTRLPCGASYLSRFNGKERKAIVVMADGFEKSQIEDDCAWLRMCKLSEGLIYLALSAKENRDGEAARG
jgi:hypothetical protein